MSTRVFIFDWQGTLDVLPNPKLFLIELREKNPECFICINSGLFSHIIADELGVDDLYEVVDEYFMKKSIRDICHQITNHPDSIYTIDNPVKDISEVIICDDSNNENTWNPEYLREFIGHPYQMFNSVATMMETL